MKQVPCTFWSDSTGQAVCRNAHAIAAKLGPLPSAGTCLLDCPFWDGPCRDTLPAARALRLARLPNAGSSDPTMMVKWVDTLPRYLWKLRAAEVETCAMCAHSDYGSQPCDQLEGKPCSRSERHVELLIDGKCPKGKFDRRADAAPSRGS